MSMDIRYLAGLFDGEGSVSVLKVKDKGPRGFHYELRVCLTMRDRIILDEVKSIYDGCVTRLKDTRHTNATAFMWAGTAKKGKRFLEDILPFLIIKKINAVNGIAFQTAKEGNGTNHHTDDMVAKYEIYSNAAYHLNTGAKYSADGYYTYETVEQVWSQLS